MATTCTECNRSFASDNDLYQHHLNTLHKCHHCGSIPSSRDGAKQHMRTHKIHNCTLCTRGFFLARSLQQHMEMSSHVKKQRKRKPKSKRTIQPVASVIYLRNNQSQSTFVTEVEKYPTFETFLKQEVYPAQSHLTKCNEIVDYLMRFLQHNTSYDVAKVVKGGSMGKGTSIKKKNDIDIAVFLNDYKSIKDLQRNMKTVLADLKEHLLHDANWAKKIKFTRFTSHSIQFQLKCHPDDELHDVDLLPAVDVLRAGSERSVYRQMETMGEHERSFMSVCLGPLQTEFVKTRPPRVKDLIRLVKHWKRTEDVDELVSYSIELIVIKECETPGKLENFDLKAGFTYVLQKIAAIDTMVIECPECYDVSKYGGLPNDKVIIMDPANPYKNTADRIRKVDKIKEKARNTIKALK
ncbi:2'-5'-oligoadenylate synthase 1A-like isoform X2 [Haliotis rufescens]|nr:2'-5'-oligoadenylate synthase 1A-like isoform X2 [Haliotis rufescens]XP_048249319.1 2'-5'-oligoadenylate synthase 1A-like isoform X2 [Haliotis rufescens]